MADLPAPLTPADCNLSWHQVPAGSLPNDDRILAHLSGAKRMTATEIHIDNWMLR